MSASVVSMGLHIADVLGRPVTAIPPGQGLALLDEITLTVAGTAAGTSVDLAKLGVSVAAVGAVGTDVLGRFVRDAMSGFGIDVTHLRAREGAQTSASLLPIRPNGERPALHVVGANALLGEDDVPWDVVAQAQVLHLGGALLLPALDGAPMARVLARAREMGVTTTLDLLGERPDARELVAQVLPHVDWALPNLEEAGVLAGSQDRAEIIAWFRAAGAGATVLTMGADGASLNVGDQEEVRLPAHEVDVVDTTGCGDGFTAGFVSGLVDGLDPVACTRRGLACGSLVATGLGSDAGIVDLAQVERFAREAPTRPLGAA